mgnify:CR=1 FL=1
MAYAGLIVLIAFMSPFGTELIAPIGEGGLFEIYIDTQLKLVEGRGVTV